MNFHQLIETSKIGLAASWIYPGRTVLIVLLLLIASLAEGFGVASILPLMSLAGDGASSDTAVANGVTAVLAFFGMEPTLAVLLAVIAIGIALKAILTFLAMAQLGLATAAIGADLRSSLLRAILSARWSFFIHQPIGVLANAFGIEANKAAGMVAFMARMFALLLQVSMYLALAVFVSWKVTIASIGAGIFVFVALDWLVGVARRASSASLASLRALLSQLADSLQGIKPLKAMALEDRVAPLLEQEIQKLNKSTQAMALAKEAMSNIQEPLLVALLSVGFYLVLTFTEISFDIVLVMGFLFYRTTSRFAQLQTAYQAVSVCREYYVGLKEKTREAERAREIHSGQAKHSLTNSIRLEQVNFSFDDTKVLDDLTLEIPAGKITAIYGPSGTGKTTATDLILGFATPASGKILVDGVDLTDIDIRHWRSRIGYIPQELFLFHDSIQRNVTLGDPSITKSDVDRALDRAGAGEFVRALPEGAETLVGERGGRLSGGQRQRVAIARALARNPDLLILDEPTTALDPETEREVCQTLSSLKGEITILAISHQQAIADIADQVFEMAGGLAGSETKLDQPSSSTATVSEHEEK